MTAKQARIGREQAKQELKPFYTNLGTSMRAKLLNEPSRQYFFLVVGQGEWKLKKLCSGMMIAMLLTSALAFAFNIEPARASGTIYIRADGNVDPSTVNITTTDSVTYDFTGNVSDSIVIEKSDLIIDGNGYVIQGTQMGNAFSWSDINNVTIRNTNIRRFSCAIRANRSIGNVFSGNVMAQNDYGIWLDSCSGNSISCNNITASSSSAACARFDSCSNISISSNSITHNLNGMLLGSCSNNSVSDNNVTNNSMGVSLGSCSGNNINGNNISSNDGTGLSLYSCFGNSVFGNSIVNNHVGVQLDSQTFGDCSNNSVFDNDITNNYIGIKLGSFPLKVSGNMIYHNNFINNTIQAFTSGWYNVWNLNYPLGGNYWSDYKTKYPNASEIDASGIWNTPYVTNNADIYPLNNADMYPLKAPHVIPEFSSAIILLSIVAIGSLMIILRKRKLLKTIWVR